MEKVLVTGAGGFIGSHLTEVLVAAGRNVRAMIHYNAQNRWGWLDSASRDVKDAVEVFPADITDPYAVQKAVKDCTMVFHLAALIAIPYSYRAPASFVDTNIKGTLNVLQACLEGGVERLVHTSTSETYGTAQYIPIDESHPLVGQSPYSASKIGADKLAESYYRSFGLPVTTVRPFNTYGPRQSARAVIPTIVAQVLAERREVRLGSLAPIRDLNYVLDTVDGLVKLSQAENAVGQVTNIGSGTGMSIKDLAGRILNLTGSSATIVQDDKRLRPDDSEVMELVCENAKARALTGWSPKTSIDEGLHKTIEWMSGNMQYYKPWFYNE